MSKIETEQKGGIVIDNITLNTLTGEVIVQRHRDPDKRVISEELEKLWISHAPTESFRKEIEEMVDRLNREGRT